jgi:hypothetical protein
VKTVGAWEATWALAAAMAIRRNPQIESLLVIVVILVLKKKGREVFVSPLLHRDQNVVGIT